MEHNHNQSEEYKGLSDASIGDMLINFPCGSGSYFGNILGRGLLRLPMLHLFEHKYS